MVWMCKSVRIELGLQDSNGFTNGEWRMADYESRIHWAGLYRRWAKGARGEDEANEQMNNEQMTNPGVEPHGMGDARSRDSGPRAHGRVRR